MSRSRPFRPDPPARPDHARADREAPFHKPTGAPLPASGAPVMGDLLLPQQSLLWILRAGFARRPAGSGLTRSLRSAKGAGPGRGRRGPPAAPQAPGYGVVESVVGAGDAPDVWAATGTVADSLAKPLPVLDTQALAPVERRLLTVAWALQTGTRIDGWPALLADLPPAAHASALAALTLIVHVLGERGQALPAPADRPAVAAEGGRQRPGLAGAPANARALVQALRLIRRGGTEPEGRDGLSAAAGHLARQGLPMAVAGGIETLLVEAASAAARGKGALPDVHAVGCPCLSRDEAALVQAVATGTAPAGGWLPTADPVVAATLQALNGDLAMRRPETRSPRR